MRTSSASSIAAALAAAEAAKEAVPRLHRTATMVSRIVNDLQKRKRARQGRPKSDTLVRAIARAEKESRVRTDLENVRTVWMSHHMHSPAMGFRAEATEQQLKEVFAEYEKITLREAARRKGVSATAISQAVMRGELDALKKQNPKGKVVAKAVYVNWRFQQWEPRPVGRPRR